MHLLLSLKLHSTTFSVIPFSLIGSPKVQMYANQDNETCTTDSFLDVYAKRRNYENSFPDIMNVNFLEFATKYKITKGKLGKRSDSAKIVPKIFPTYSPNPKGTYYGMYCRYQLLTYKPWENSQNDAWGCTQPDDRTFLSAWHGFSHTSYAAVHAPDWGEKLSNASENVEQPTYDPLVNQESKQDEWMFLSDFYNSNKNIDLCPAVQELTSNHNWTSYCTKYSNQQIGKMPSWMPNHCKHLTKTVLVKCNGLPMTLSKLMQKAVN